MIVLQERDEETEKKMLEGKQRKGVEGERKEKRLKWIMGRSG